MDANNEQSMDPLRDKRHELRNRLAMAWEMREPLDQIRDIETQIRDIWRQMDELEGVYTAVLNDNRSK